MRALDRKLLRDLRRARGQVVTIALVMACGLASFVALQGTYRTLLRSRDAYYERHGFPHLFARVRRAPEHVADRLRELPGVAEVETRLDQPVLVDVPGMVDAASGRIIALPDGAAASTRHLVLLAGRGPDPTRPDEVIVIESFARAHGLAPGDTLATLVGGRRVSLRISGLAISPEFIFPIAENGMPDDRRFTVLWMARPALAAIVGAEGAFDEVTLRLGPGARPRVLLPMIDAILAPWGSLGAHDRDKQLSHMFITGEIEQLEGLATRVPLIFLAVAAFLMHVTLGRLIQTHREQIAALKALGYRAREIGLHYLELVGAIGLLGVAAGLGLGALVGEMYSRAYARFFRLPVLEYHLDADLALVAAAVGLGVALAGGARAVRRAARLPPAEAMRPPVPARYRRGILSRFGLARLTGVTGAIVVRELERRPWRAVLSIAGIALAGGILVLARFSQDAMDYLVDVQFHRAMGADVTVVLAEPTPLAGGLAQARTWPGVLAAEPARAIPVRLRHGHIERDLALTGLRPDDDLRQVIDREGRRLAIPARGLLLTDILAERLGVGVGDLVTVERMDGDRRVLSLPVAALAAEMSGRNAYMDLHALHRALGETAALSTLQLRVDASALDELQRHLKRTPGVAAVVSRRALIDAFGRTSGSFTAIFTLVIVGFGVIIAVGVLYNNARVALSERARDLASLRIIGYTRDEVTAVVLGELGVHMLVAVPLGLVVGWLMAVGVASTVDPEQYRLPVVLSGQSYAFAAVVLLAAAALTSITVRRRIDRLDLASALKAKD